MIRNCSLEEISDGKLYSENDMVKTDTNQCQGCNSVCCHGARPGICRLFPLGRYWQDDTHFQYILQKDECHKHNLTKIKVKKWLDTPDLEAYNAFLVTWHAFLKEIQAAQQGLDEGQNRILTMYILKSFFALPYDGRDFYVQFEERMKKARQDLAMD